MYLKKGDKITNSLKQTFENEFTLRISDMQLIKMRQAGQITDRDMEIVNFLFEYKFARASQLIAFLKEDPEESNLLARLDKLVQYRVLNKFALADVPMNKIPEDALQIYCLDLGGKHLLKSYSKVDTVNWFTTVNLKASELINRNLIINDIYLAMRKTLGDRLLNFNVEPDYVIGKKAFNPSFEIIFKSGNNTQYLLGGITRREDFPILFRERFNAYDTLLNTNTWKKYFYGIKRPPVLLVFAENDYTALESAKAMTTMTDITAFRVTTDKRLQEKKLYELGCFLKYVPEKENLMEIKASSFK